MTNKEFNELKKQYEPIYIADEYKDNKHWVVWAFKEVEGEYSELQHPCGRTPPRGRGEEKCFTVLNGK